MLLYLIAGHGDGDSGAVGNGYREADQVRKLADRIKALGGDAVQVHPKSRNAYAEDDLRDYKFPAGAQVVELHMDSGPSSARGAHVIIDGSLTADKYDTALANALAAFFPGRANKIVRRDDLKNVNQAANRGISYRLVENGFISNKADADKFERQIDDLARIYLNAFGIEGGEDWSDMATKEEIQEAVWGKNIDGKRADALLALNGSTKDPTGRNVALNDHDHIKWIAATLVDLKAEVAALRQAVLVNDVKVGGTE